MEIMNTRGLRKNGGFSGWPRWYYSGYPKMMVTEGQKRHKDWKFTSENADFHHQIQEGEILRSAGFIPLALSPITMKWCCFLSLAIYIYLYLFISIYIYLYLFISIYIYLYLFISIYIYLYLFISIYIYLYLFISIYIYLYLFISIYIYLLVHHNSS